MDTNIKRQPKGIAAGGQFAPGTYPECTLVLGSHEIEDKKPDNAEPVLWVGQVLKYGAKVVKWVERIYEDNVVVQVWHHEWGDDDTDCEGWEPRTISQILRGRDVPMVTMKDLRDLLDDADFLQVAIRPDISDEQLLEAINSFARPTTT